MTLWRLIVRSLSLRPGRAVLTLGSIIIGVAGVVSVGLAVRTTRGAYQQMYEALAGRAALEIHAMGGGGGFDESVLEQLKQIPGIEAAVPSIQQFAVLYHDRKDIKQNAKILAVGIDPAIDHEVRDYDVLAGKFFDQGEGLLLESSFARSMGIELGDEVRLLTSSGRKHVKVVGLLSPRGAAAFAQGTAAFLTLPTMQSYFRMRGKVDAIQIVLQPEADQTAVRDAVASVLPTGVAVGLPAGRTQLADETLNGVEQALSVAGTLSLFLAVFIIVNTFLMSVSERRKQWAILRAIGATRSQVVRLLLSEGLLFGLIGTTLGLLGGLGGAFLLTRAMERLVGSPLPAIQLSIGPLALGVALGMGVSVVSTYFPAVRAGRVSPLEGMRSATKLDSQGVPWWVTMLGGLVVFAGCGVIFAASAGYMGRDKLVTGGVVALMGCVPLLPSVLEPFTRVIAAILSVGMPVETSLASGQVLRRRVRTTLTAGVLFVAVGCGIGLAATIIDNVRDVQNWLHSTLQGDFYVRAMNPDLNSGGGTNLPDSLGEEISKIPGIKSMTSALIFRGRAADHDVQIVAKPFPPDQPLPLYLKVGDPKLVRRKLVEGQVVVGTVLAQKAQVKPGDSIEVETSHGKKSVQIAAMNNDYSGGGMTVYFDRAAAEKLWDIHGATLYVINAVDVPKLPAVEAALSKITEREGLILQSSATLFRSINSMLMGVVGGLWVLLALALLVAAFGVVNTLTMNVLEQTRELGLLRAVAMTRRQMRWMVLLQAFIIGVIGLAPGTLAGILLAYLMNTGTLPMLGHPINFDLSPALLVVTFTGAIVMVLSAAWGPAMRASRLNVITALHQD